MMACGPAQHQNTHLKHPLNISHLNPSLRTQHSHLIHPYSTPYTSLTHIHLTHPSTSSLNPPLSYPLPTIPQLLTYPHLSFTQPFTHLSPNPHSTLQPPFTNPSRILNLLSPNPSPTLYPTLTQPYIHPSPNPSPTPPPNKPN